MEGNQYWGVTVKNAIHGVKNVIRHRQQFIKGLDDISKDWTDDSVKQMIETVQDFMTKDIGAFEWILGELQYRKKMRYDSQKSH